MYTSKIKETLLILLPHWNYHITNPLKQMLSNEINLEMYYCLQALNNCGAMTMTEFSHFIHIPPHKLSKISNRLFEQGLIEREYDTNDRRVIRIKVTKKAITYLQLFFEENTDCFDEFLCKMDDTTRKQFGEAAQTLLTIFFNINND